VHLSNRFGTAPLTVASVYLGVQDEGASVVAGTQRAVSFGGVSEVTIPAGEDVVSDEVAFAVNAFEPLALSAYVPAPGGEITVHTLALQTSYRAPEEAGDVAADEDGSAYTTSIAVRPLVVGLDVRASGSHGAVAAVGDSLTDGYEDVIQSGTDQNRRYPDELARVLLAADDTLSALNLGISGNRVISGPQAPRHGPSLLDRLDADLLAREDVTDVIVWEGINDLGMLPGSTADELLAGLADVVARLETPQSGRPAPRVHVATLTPAGGTEASLPTYGQADDQRELVNAAIRAGELGEYVVDFDAAVRDPDDPSRLAPQYDGGDNLHLSPEGYTRLAQELDLDSFARRNCAP
jgi:lysophospholipase L1-like esterase